MLVPLSETLSFAGKIALVTGATAGIGKSCAIALALQGATVIALGTNSDRGKEVEDEIFSLTQEKRILFRKVDVSDKKQVEEVFQEVLKLFPRLDILVNNAGITRDQLLLRMSEEDFDKVLDVNLKACFYTCQLALRPMLKARQGKIINVSSVVGLTGNAGQCNYAASKGGLIAFSKSLAKEVASRNIQVNCIAPGFIETAMTGQLESKKKELEAMIPLGRFGAPEEVALALLFLASPMSAYITGQVLVVDGGLAM